MRNVEKSYKKIENHVDLAIVIVYFTFIGRFGKKGILVSRVFPSSEPTLCFCK